MKTISIAEFKSLVARSDWQREQEHDIFKKAEGGFWGWASKTSTLGDITIRRNEEFEYSEFDPDSLCSRPLQNGVEGPWNIEGVTVIDNAGDELDVFDLGDCLSSEFSSIDYSVLDIEKTVDIDTGEDEDEDMETITLSIDNKPNIRFTGELLASAASSGDPARGSDYSGSVKRWAELELYRTKGGKFVCYQVGRTLWVNERDRRSGTVCETAEEVTAFFGYRWLAKKLYAQTDAIDCAIEVK